MTTFGGIYWTYAAHVPAFIPRLRSLPAGPDEAPADSN
jgi:hypothetical protein